MPDSDEKKELDGVARSIAALFSDVEVQSAEDSFGPPAEAEPVEASLVPPAEAEPVEASLVPRPEAEPAGDVPVPLEPEAPLPFP